MTTANRSKLPVAHDASSPAAAHPAGHPTAILGSDGRVHAVTGTLHTYNVVFACRGSDRLIKYGYCTVRMNMRIEYGSDLDTLRMVLVDSLAIPDLTVVSWHILTDAVRPDGVVPLVQITV